MTAGAVELVKKWVSKLPRIQKSKCAKFQFSLLEKMGLHFAHSESKEHIGLTIFLVPIF